jgi:hypothetical protein
VPGVSGDNVSIHSSSSGISSFSQCEEVKTGIAGVAFVCCVNTVVQRVYTVGSTPNMPAASVVWWSACWPLVPKIAGLNPAEAVGFFRRKNPQHAFLRRGSKAVCPTSQICGMLKNPVIYVEVRITGQSDWPFLARNSVLR